MKNNKAFTVTELIVTTTLIFIMVALWVFIGRGHIKVAMLNEGRIFIDQIIDQERRYIAVNGVPFETGSYVTKSAPLFIDAKSSGYFSAFKVLYSIKKVSTSDSYLVTIMVKDSTENSDDAFNHVKITAVYSTTCENKDAISYTEEVK